MDRVVGAVLIILCVSFPVGELPETSRSASSLVDSASPPPITEITLERRCFGCEREISISLARSGVATLTMFGNARRGSSDRLLRGSISQRDFESIAQLIRRVGFLALRDEYRDPQIADGETVRIAVAFLATRKTVTASNGAGPPTFRRIEAAIAALQKRIKWSASQ